MGVTGDAPAVSATPTPSAAQPDDAEVLAAFRRRGGYLLGGPYQLSRSVFLRALGFIYVIAFSVLVQQALPLIGLNGLLPAARYVERLRSLADFWSQPTLFWYGASDRALGGWALAGLALSLLVLCGVDNALLMFALWALYLSFVHVGQVFYGYGWETLLLEAGFLAIFLCPVTRLWTLRDPSPPPAIMFVWLNWLLFRVMFGAGLIKLRGDVCWRDLSCLMYHYETQPVPHALSRVLHHAPSWFHQLGVLFNHFVELIAPFGLFLGRRPRHASVLCIIAFQVVLILSGNLSFLNWLTIAVALGCIDDSLWSKLLPRRIAARAAELDKNPRDNRARTYAAAAYSCAAVFLSIAPVLNMLSPTQRMNTSFEPLHLLNSYGAFGSIGRVRDEVILEGTDEPDATTATHWRAYEFKCKPGDVQRRPCWITPYHYRLDWQMWFAALSNYQQEPWIVHLVYKLLHNDAGQLSLLAQNPFPKHPPRFIRAERYRYRFTRLGSDAYWTRERLGSYLPPVSLADPRLWQFLVLHDLRRADSAR